MIEETIWEGTASPLSVITVVDVLLTLLTMGIWVAIPLLKIMSVRKKQGLVI